MGTLAGRPRGGPARQHNFTVKVGQSLSIALPWRAGQYLPARPRQPLTQAPAGRPAPRGLPGNSARKCLPPPRTVLIIGRTIVRRLSPVLAESRDPLDRPTPDPPPDRSGRPGRAGLAAGAGAGEGGVRRLRDDWREGRTRPARRSGRGLEGPRRPGARALSRADVLPSRTAP